MAKGYRLLYASGIEAIADTSCHSLGNDRHHRHQASSHQRELRLGSLDRTLLLPRDSNRQSYGDGDGGDDISEVGRVRCSEINLLPPCSGRLKSISIPAERRLLAIRRSALLNTFGALGQRPEQRVPSLVIVLMRIGSSLVVPLKPSVAYRVSGL
jgi:hypothetical protein